MISLISFMYFKFSAVPSSAPQLSYGVAVSPIQLNITWLPPPVIDINGVIKHYNIEVTENITGQVTTYNVTDDHIIIGPVLPGNAYCCRVAAFTIGLGLFTDYFIVTSQEIGINNCDMVDIVVDTLIIRHNRPLYIIQLLLQNLAVHL